MEKCLYKGMGCAGEDRCRYQAHAFLQCRLYPYMVYLDEKWSSPASPRISSNDTAAIAMARD